jgi:hypothetical protein
MASWGAIASTSMKYVSPMVIRLRWVSMTPLGLPVVPLV